MTNTDAHACIHARMHMHHWQCYRICLVMANPNHTCLAVYTVYVWLWPILSIRGWPYNPYMYGYGQSLSYVSHAGTDANVFINIFGKSGETGKTALEDPLK